MPAASASANVDVRKHVPALDGLRGLAILVVLVHNTSINNAASALVEKIWTAITDAGWVGVQLFFVLSGYLITGLLLDGRHEPRALRTFYVRRSLRIFPLYYLFLALRLLVLPLFIPALAVGASTQVWYWLYVSNWADLAHGAIHGLGHFWSLAVEEQFYLTWPAAVRKLSVRGLTWLCAALAVGALAARIAFYAADVDHTWIYSSTIARADGLAIGALVAIAVRSSIELARFTLVRRVVGFGSAIGLAIVAAMAHGLSRYNPAVETIGYTLLALLFAAIVAEVVQPAPHRAWRWLEVAALRAVGRYSYAMYVFHLPIRYAIQYYANDWLAARSVEHPIATDILWVTAIAIISFIAAAISYALIERPFLRLKDRWAPR
jgi:peptidoglycan/LPS O-acetylase OafA/YrhL